METETGKVLQRFHGLPDGVSAIAFSPNDKMLAWGGWNDPTVHLIELASGKERHRFVGQSGRVLTLSFSPDGTMLLSGNDDTTAVVWDVTGRLREKPMGGKPLATADLDAIWNALAGDDAPKAFQGVQKLAGSPKDAGRYLHKRLEPVPAVEEEVILKLIKNLDSDRFNTRDRAARELDKLGESALGPCEDVLAGKPSVELRRRLEAFKNKLAEPWRNPPPEQLRIIRALEALEMCGTAEARAVLTRLARGARGAYLTKQAKAALDRRQRR
jgi:hypothetical protein